MKTVLNVKTDKEVKEKAQRVAKNLGVPLSLVVNAYLKEFIREQEFTLSFVPKLRPEVGKMLLEASADFRRGINISPAFSNGKDVDEYLDS
jgi:addiction module RelB/DinJ family antitoxin